MTIIHLVFIFGLYVYIQSAI